MITPRTHQSLTTSQSQTRKSQTASVSESFDGYVCNAFVKIAQVVAEARLLAPGVRERQKNKNFLLETRVVAEVDEELHTWVESFPRCPLVLTIAIDTNAETSVPSIGSAVSCRMHSPPASGAAAGGPRYMVLERWILQYEPGKGTRFGEAARSSDAKQLFLLVRTVHSCLRMLPCHKTVAQVKSRGL